MSIKLITQVAAPVSKLMAPGSESLKLETSATKSQRTFKYTKNRHCAPDLHRNCVSVHRKLRDEHVPTGVQEKIKSVLCSKINEETLIIFYKRFYGLLDIRFSV